MPEPPDWVICFVPDGPGGPRAGEALTEQDAEKIRVVWEMLGGAPDRFWVDRCKETATAYDSKTRLVRFGSDVYPGSGRSPNEAMGMSATIAHELRHLQRHDEGIALDEPDLESADEAITSLEATRYEALSVLQRWELVWDALQRLHRLRYHPRNPIDPLDVVRGQLLAGLARWVEEARHGN